MSASEPDRPAYTYAARVVRWVDGDTVDLAVDLGFHTRLEGRFRLWGLDTPERSQAGWAEAGAMARELAPEGSEVVVRTHRAPDKYGRWLAEVVSPVDGSVNRALLASGLARPYDGGAKA